MEKLTFSTFEYYLDQSDPDVLLLRRNDGAFVAAFSARGATEGGIIEAVKEDRRELIRARTNLLGLEAVIVAPVRLETTDHVEIETGESR
jgi:hypothetical protein